MPWTNKCFLFFKFAWNIAKVMVSLLSILCPYHYPISVYQPTTLTASINIITVMPHEHHGITKHWQLDCLFNNLLRITILALCERKPPVTGGFPSQGASNAESISMLWHHHGGNNHLHIYQCYSSNWNKFDFHNCLHTNFLILSILIKSTQANFSVPSPSWDSPLTEL